MVEFKQGDLLLENCETLVNTVNCVGVMGKGIALQFKQAYPENFLQYERACQRGEVRLGQMFTVLMNTYFYPKYIINFPTKGHWKDRSRLQDVRSGLNALVGEIQRLNIISIAIPPLGCGNGGLDWGEVKPLVVSALDQLPKVRAIVFEP